MDPLTVVLILGGVYALIAMIFRGNPLPWIIVPVGHKVVITRLGKVIKESGPGWMWLVNPLDRVEGVPSSQTRTLKIRESATTKGPSPVELPDVEMFATYQVTDATAWTTGITAQARDELPKGILTAALRALVGQNDVDGVLARKGQTLPDVMAAMNESSITKGGGLKFLGVSLTDVSLPDQLEQEFAAAATQEIANRAFQGTAQLLQGFDRALRADVIQMQQLRVIEGVESPVLITHFGQQASSPASDSDLTAAVLGEIRKLDEKIEKANRRRRRGGNTFTWRA